MSFLTLIISSLMALATEAVAASSLEPMARVSVWPDVKVTGETVFGKDLLASCTATDPAVCERLKALAVCPTPRLGQTKRLAVNQLRQLLGSTYQLDTSVVAITMTRPAQTIRRKQLEEAFEKQLSKDVNPYLKDRKIALKSVTSLGPITLEDAPVTMSFAALHEPLPDKAWFKSEVVIAQPSLGEVARYPVAIHLSRKLRVVTLARSVAAGTALTRKDLSYTYLDHHRVHSRHYRTKKEALGLKSRAPKAKGTILVSYQWRNPHTIAVRKKVDVTLKGKNFAIRTSGTTLEEGRTGDTIWLQVGKKAKKMQGVIINSQQVEVSL